MVGWGGWAGKGRAVGLGVRTICLSVRLDVTVQGLLIFVMQRLAGQEEKAWYLLERD